jgi:hypothetical protein
VGGSIAGAIFGAVLTAQSLPSGIPSERAFETFWLVSAAACLLAAMIASVYLVTYWSGFRGGDRAMVRRDRTAFSAPRPWSWLRTRHTPPVD